MTQTTKEFLSTPSARRATWHTPRCFVHEVISIHALREEGDLIFSSFSSLYGNFYPRPPRGGRLAFKAFTKPLCKISIHALREEGDPNCEA